MFPKPNCRSSIVGNGSTPDSLYYIWSCFLATAAKNVATGSLASFLVILNWSLFWLHLGRWPTHHWDGTAYLPGSKAYSLAHDTKWLADGFYGVLWALIGDLDYFYKWLNLENHASTTAPCMICPANLVDPNWRDFRSTAAWVGRLYTHASWVAAHPNRLSIFFLQFVTVYTLCADYMHCKYLGVDQYLFGGVLWYMVHVMMPLADPVANMSVLMIALKAEFRKEQVSSYSMITVNMFANSDSRKLRGRASEIRHLAKALLSVFRDEMTKRPYPAEHVDFQRLIRASLRLNAHIDELLDQNPGWAVKGEPYEKLKRTAHDFATTYSALSVKAAELELDVFSVTIKLHYLLHICRFADRLHPKLTWCFGGETFMHISKQLMQSCMVSRRPYQATMKFADKYCYALHYMFQNISRD